MKFTATKVKITARHLTLLAIIYIRQSTKHQVAKNKGSAAYQRSFTDLARRYGWPDDLIVIVDQDQGHSGTSSAKRHGMEWVRQEIFDKRVGAVICAEESRLGRDFSEFAQLVKLCAVYNTLIIDEKGVYDPNNSNDLITLGIVGVLSNAEVLRNADRSAAARGTLAEEGRLLLPPPTGYIYNDEDKLVLDTDEEVQAALRLLFCKFDEHGTALQVTKFFNRNDILFPSRVGGYYIKNREIVWGKLREARVLSILHSPVFAGTFVYGRSKVDLKMVSADANEQKKTRVLIGWDDDDVILIRDAHQAYVEWEKFLQNQVRIKDNRYIFRLESSGAVRDGSALLQGRVQCGSCLRNMYTNYNVNKYASYVCNNQVSEYGLYICLSVSARHLDTVVTDALLEALNPAQLQITLQSLEEMDKQPEVNDQQELDALKRAQDEVDEAQRKFDKIDPENYLVAKEYEKRLQAKMVEVKRLERKRAKATKVSGHRLPEEVRESLLALSQDVRNFWACDAVTHAERKSVIRHLIERVSVKRREDSIYLDVTIHWVTGNSTSHTTVSDCRFIHPEAVELMRKLAPDHTVRQIVEQLNRAGLKPAKAERFSSGIIYDAFRTYGITIGCRLLPKSDGPRGDGMYPLREVAKMLNKSRQTIIH